jgi:hypothetical protein
VDISKLNYRRTTERRTDETIIGIVEKIVLNDKK